MSTDSFSTVALFPEALHRLEQAVTVQDRQSALHDMDTAFGLLNDYLATMGQADSQLVRSCNRLYNDLGKITEPFEHADGTAGTYDVPAYHAANLPAIARALSSYIDQENAFVPQNGPFNEDEDYVEYGMVEQDDNWRLFTSEIKALGSMITEYQEEADSNGETFEELWVILARNDSDTFHAAVTRELPDAHSFGW